MPLYCQLHGQRASTRACPHFIRDVHDHAKAIARSRFRCEVISSVLRQQQPRSAGIYVTPTVGIHARRYLISGILSAIERADVVWLWSATNQKRGGYCDSEASDETARDHSHTHGHILSPGA